MRIKMTHAVFPEHVQELAGPKWPNGCCHKDAEYVGTVKYFQAGGLEPMQVFDVYVHEDVLACLAHVCLRYGKQRHEYISYGTVLDFLVAAGHHKDNYYPPVAALLLKKLDFFCEFRERK